MCQACKKKAAALSETLAATVRAGSLLDRLESTAHEAVQALDLMASGKGDDLGAAMLRPYAVWLSCMRETARVISREIAFQSGVIREARDLSKNCPGPCSGE